jgi:hypothetical protein
VLSETRAPSDFDRSVDLISTKGADYAPHITTCSPSGFSDLPTALLFSNRLKRKRAYRDRCLTKKEYNLPFVIFQAFSDLQWWLMGVISLFVAVLGLTSNLVACIVLLQKKMRNAFNELLTILATFDSLFLIFNGVGSLYVLNPSLGMWQFTT